MSPGSQVQIRTLSVSSVLSPICVVGFGRLGLLPGCFVSISTPMHTRLTQYPSRLLETCLCLRSFDPRNGLMIKVRAVLLLNNIFSPACFCRKFENFRKYVGGGKKTSATRNPTASRYFYLFPSKFLCTYVHCFLFSPLTPSTLQLFIFIIF